MCERKKDREKVEADGLVGCFDVLCQPRDLRWRCDKISLSVVIRVRAAPSCFEDEEEEGEGEEDVEGRNQ